MIIADLPCLAVIAADNEAIIGGKQNDYYDNRASAVALAYADGSEVSAAAGTLVYIDQGVSKSQSFSDAQALS